MVPTLQNERVTLRPLTLDDAAALHPMYNNPTTMRFIPSPPHQTIAETHDYLTQELNVPGAINWAICLKGSHKPIGAIKYLGQTRVPALGYVLHQDYWGQGITVEACRAALAHGFNDLDLDRVEVWIEEENSASLRVAQKLNFRYKGRVSVKFSHRAQQHMMFVLGLRRHEWQSKSGATAVSPPPEPTTPYFFRAQPVLMAHDVAQTAAFYRDKLGFAVDFLFGDPPVHAAVSRGEWTGAMTVIQFTKVPPDRPITPSAYIQISVSSGIDSLHEEYFSNGIEIISEPTTHPWGLREFEVRDLNGHVLRFAAYA